MILLRLVISQYFHNSTISQYKYNNKVPATVPKNRGYCVYDSYKSLLYFRGHNSSWPINFLYNLALGKFIDKKIPKKENWVTNIYINR